MTAATRVGWCPGALRPMQSGDGLLVRIKPHCAILSLDQAAGLAELADRCGNGQIDLTGRANLQIRGVSERTLDLLQAGLDRLALLDPNPELEAVRGIVASPLAGLDPEACCDIRPLVAALETRLASDPACRDLPPKWSMAVDDGGTLSLDGVAADLRFLCAPDGVLLVGVGNAWATTTTDRVADTLSAIAAVVAAHRPARMRDLVELLGAEAILAAAGLEKKAEPPMKRPAISPDGLLGHHGRWVGVSPPFGSLDARALGELVEAARRIGAHDLRLTPWRMLLFTTPGAARQLSPVIARRRSRRGDPGGAEDLNCFAPLAMTERVALVEELAAFGFVTRATDPRLGIVACVGAPSCHRATVAARADAARLAGMTAPGPAVRVHVSGCAKGCARPGATPWTLIGREGRYDVVRDGTAGDAPVARGLSFNAAATWVSGSGRVHAPLGIP